MKDYIKLYKPRSEYPLKYLAVGDSFKCNSWATRDQINSAIKYHSKKEGMKFSLRKESDGFRVWRVA